MSDYSQFDAAVEALQDAEEVVRISLMNENELADHYLRVAQIHALLSVSRTLAASAPEY